MSKELVRSLIDSGIHFGHRSSRWNPKMAPYIFGKRSLIHIIDVRETLKGLIRAKGLVAKVVAGGKDVLLVGTKRQARATVERIALEHDMHYVNDRWLGGTLTNFRTIRSRLARLEELEKMQEDGTMEAASKKQGAAFRRELRKIRRNLQGIRRMERLPGVLVLVDQKREIIAIKEARKLRIPTICLLDTDSDPDVVDLPIPGNDDAMRAIELILGEIGKAIALGKAGRVERERREAAGESQFRRRSARPVTASATDDLDQDSGQEGETPAPETATVSEPAPAPIEQAEPAEPEPMEPVAATPAEPEPPAPAPEAPAEPVKAAPKPAEPPAPAPEAPAEPVEAAPKPAEPPAPAPETPVEPIEATPSPAEPPAAPAAPAPPEPPGPVEAPAASEAEPAADKPGDG